MTLSDYIADIFHFLYSVGPLLPDDDESSWLAHLDSHFLRARRESWGGMSGKINDILIDSRHTTAVGGEGRDVDECLRDDKDGIKPCLGDL